MKLVKGTEGDEEVFTGISWSSGGDNPSGYSIIR